MAQTLNISLPKALVKEADRVARRQATSRSELIRQSLRAYIQRVRAWEQAMAYGREKAKELGIKNEEDVYRMLDRRGR